MIPEFMSKIGRIAQQRIQIAHYGYYRLGLTRALRTVVDRQKRIDHFVYVAAVLRQKELASRIVVIFFIMNC